MNDLVLIASAVREKPENYAAALKRVGVAEEKIRILLPAQISTDEARELGRKAAGLVLSGGADMHPRHFGEEPVPGANLAIDEDRDLMEIALIEGAREGKTPVWGVCRGIQVFNAVLGGTLWQDLPSQVPGTLLHHQSFPNDALIHSIEVESQETWLGRVLGRELALVNSRHHQGIKDLAPGFQVVGRAPDGLVEAVSWTRDDWWVHGVQWHPENLIAMAQERALWEHFADRVRERSPRAAAAATAT